MSTSILPFIQSEMNLYGYSILLVVGTIGNIFLLILFNQHKHNACSIYLINSAFANILYLTVGGFFRMYSSSYNNQSIGALILCRMSFYIPGFLGQATKTLVIFACIDRFLITSNRASFRAFSTPKRAKYFTVLIYIAWAIIPSHLLIWLTISNGQCIMLGSYAIFYAFYGIFFICLTPSVIVSMFAYLTYKNLKQLRNRIQPTAQDANQANHSLKRRDRDLLVLVMAEVLIYILTTSPLTIVYLDRMITQFVFPVKSLLFVQAEVFALNLAFLLIFVFSAIPFYTYIIASASFRQDFKRFILTGYRKIRRSTTEQGITGVQQSTLQQNTRI